MAVLMWLRDAVRLVRVQPAWILFLLSPCRATIEHDVRRWVHCLQRGHERESTVRQLAWLMAAYPEFRNLFGYRLGRLRAALLRPLYRPLATLHIHVDDLGPGLFIQHGFATIIVGARIGRDCWINQQVTLGHVYDRGAPVLGDRVTVGAGAVVVGPVSLGDDVNVGANTTVVRDVPSGAVVVSAPVRIIERSPLGGMPRASAESEIVLAGAFGELTS